MRFIRLGALATTVSALFTDQAFKVDWQLAQIGIPLLAKVPEGGNDVFTYTDKDQLARLDSDGHLVWRRDVKTESLEISPDNRYVLTVDPDITVWNLDTGAKEWATTGANPLAIWVYRGLVTSTDSTVTLFSPVTNKVWSKDFNSPVLNLETIDETVVVTVENEQVVLSVASGEVISTQAGSYSAQPKKDLVAGAIELSDSLTLSSDQFGQVQLVNKADGAEVWTRPEGLADVVVSQFLSEQSEIEKISSQTTLLLSNASVIDAWYYRTLRHVSELQALGTEGLVSWVRSLASLDKSDSILGGKKLLLALTARGSIYALDTYDAGKIQWVKHEVDADDIRIFGHIAVLFKDEHPSSAINFDGNEVDIPANVLEASHQPYDYSLDGNVVVGRSLSGASHVDTWQYSAGEGYQVVGIAKRDPKDETASIGTVVKQGEVLYKYMNPNAIAIASYHRESKNLVVTVIDGITGRVLHSASHADKIVISDQYPFNIVFGEHWIVYGYLSQDVTHSSMLSVWDFYESGTPNTRRGLPEDDEGISALADDHVPYVAKKTFLLKDIIFGLGTSRTKFGAVTRQVLVSTAGGQILALPKTILSAEVDATTTESWTKGTGAASGSAVIEVPPAVGILSHLRVLKGVRHFVTEPTELESTYVLGSFGDLDLFYTRVAPSGEIDRLSPAFAEGRLLIIVAVLVVGALYLSQWARQTQLRSAWR